MAKEKHGKCPLCNRTTALTFHHLIPRKVHRRAHFKKHYSKSELNQGVNICRNCHNGIHRRYDEMSLAKRLHTLDALLRDEELSRFFTWVSKQRIR